MNYRQILTDPTDHKNDTIRQFDRSCEFHFPTIQPKFATASRSGNFRIWTLESAQLLASFKQDPNHRRNAIAYPRSLSSKSRRTAFLRPRRRHLCTLDAPPPPLRRSSSKGDRSRVSFDVYTWGKKMRVDIPKSSFENYFWVAIAGY